MKTRALLKFSVPLLPVRSPTVQVEVYETAAATRAAVKRRDGTKHRRDLDAAFMFSPCGHKLVMVFSYDDLDTGTIFHEVAHLILTMKALRPRLAQETLARMGENAAYQIWERISDWKMNRKMRLG